MLPVFLTACAASNEYRPYPDLPATPSHIRAEAMRAPVAIPPKGDSNADAMRLLTKVRRSELQYRRALQQSVAHSDRTKRAYDVKRKAKK